VRCHQINGDKLWKFQDVAIISEPRGVAVDRDLNVYVVSTGNNSVVVISPDGKRCRTVLGKSDGTIVLCYPITPDRSVNYFLSLLRSKVYDANLVIHSS
jgi:DNA-binding beta-propeller fold protein YncE